MKDLTEDERALWFAVFGAAYAQAVRENARVLHTSLVAATESASFAEAAADIADLAVRDMRATFGPGGGCEGYGPEWFRLS